MSTLKLEVRPGESITIGDGVIVTLEEKSGQIARLSFQADRSIPIKRVEQGGSSMARLGLDVAKKP